MDIINEVLKEIPNADRKVTDALFEAANIVLYTKDTDFLINGIDLIKEIVSKVKKRIELRAHPSVVVEQEIAEEKIKAIIGKEAEIDQIIFDPQRSVVNIEVDKPGVAIGKSGETLQKIKSETFWVPVIKRKPAIRSPLIENIRSVLYANTDYRKKFLHQTGERIYNGYEAGKRDPWVRLTFLGSARQVGRSCILLSTPQSRILLDCGIDVSNDDEAYPYLEAPEFNIKDLDAVILSHAHIDHSGLIPYLYKFGYRGPVYCTLPTRDISALIQLDAIKIQRNDGRDSVYSTDEVKEFVKHTIWLGYEEVADIAPDIRITLYDAGHILGSAAVHINVGNGAHNLLYSGDQKFATTNLLSAAHTKFTRVETLILESTYGAKDKVLGAYKEQNAEFSEQIINTVNRKGKVLMPVLGSGRAQEIIVLMEKLIREKKIPKIPIYVDGMVWDITAIHTAYPEFFNASTRQQIFHKDNNPFLMDNLKQIGSPKERKQVIEEKGSCIIIATSGMLVGGPSVQYLQSMITDKRNLLAFSCYQAPGTTGRKISGGASEVTFHNNGKPETLPVKMEVSRVEISGHSDRKELMDFVKKLNPRPRKIIVNHGEPGACLDLASSLYKQFKVETVAPRNLETIRLR